MLSVKDISDRHYGGGWGAQRYSMRIMTVLSPGVKHRFSAIRHRSQESCAMFVKEPGTPRRGGLSNKKINAANPHLTTLHTKLWDSVLTCGGPGVGVLGRSPCRPPSVTPFMPHGTKNGVFDCNFSARSVQGRLSQRAHAECAHFKADERHQKHAAASLQGRNGEHACLIRSSISVSTPPCCTGAETPQTETVIYQHTRHPEPESWGDVFGSSQG